MRIHVGCGLDYKEGWINIDNNKEVKADLYIDLNEPLPFADNSIEEVFSEGCVEHLNKDKVFKFYDELWRVCMNGVEIKILTNHFSSVWATQHLSHQCYYGTSTFDVMGVDDCFNGERYGKARFKVKKIRLLFFYPKMTKYGFLRYIPIDFFLNFNLTWQRICERFNPLGIDGIAYTLEVVKDGDNSN